MKTRNFALCALGLAAAITIGGAETASAQAASQKRIPVRKDAPAEAAMPAHVDTIRIVRVDTVTIRGRTDTVTMRMRPDTVIQMQMLPLQRLPGLYLGLGGGVAIPMNNWRNSTKDGGAVQGILGWFPKDGACFRASPSKRICIWARIARWRAPNSTRTSTSATPPFRF